MHEQASTEIVLTPEERHTLEALEASRTAPVREVQRARIILLAAKAQPNTAISQIVGMDPRHVGIWRRRFAAERLAGLEDRPRRGKPRVYGDTLSVSPIILNEYTRGTGPANKHS